MSTDNKSFRSLEAVEPMPTERSQFEHCKLTEPESIAFVHNDKGMVEAIGFVLKDIDGSEIKFAMRSDVFLQFAAQVAKQIGIASAAAKERKVITNG